MSCCFPPLCSFSWSASCRLRSLHSFPTRRSSDLRRAPDKRVAPDKLDNFVAGGIGNGHGLEETLLKEGEEEASMPRSEEHTSELQSRQYLVCRLLLEKKKPTKSTITPPSMHRKPS